jgi:hypothetical protein
MTAPKLQDLRGAADLLGMRYETVRHYHQAAERNRREDRVRPGDFPPPDQQFGRSPVWKTATLLRWQRRRPGRGAFGGRPRKQATN